MKWFEHKVLNGVIDTLDSVLRRIKREEKNGWELVSVEYHSSRIDSNWRTLWMKRERTGEPLSKPWKTVATYPGGRISEDKHDTAEAANAVRRLLLTEGNDWGVPTSVVIKDLEEEKWQLLNRPIP